MALPLLSASNTLICTGMEIQLNPDQEARLDEFARRNGRKADDLVREAVDRFLDDEARFAEAVRLGLVAAESGDFVASEEVWAGVERILKT
jgi:predicted transcriptional regulator